MVSASGEIIVTGTDCGVAQVFSGFEKEPLELPHWSRTGGRWRKAQIDRTQNMVQIVTVSNFG